MRRRYHIWRWLVFGPLPQVDRKLLPTVERRLLPQVRMSDLPRVRR
jgi:hypothetical protein